ncbi:hypothetical protein RFI_19403, partial [Reticulomyxa filosa]
NHDIRKNFPRLKVLSLESVKGSWRQQWLQETLNAMCEKMIMFRLFDVKWNWKHPLVLPKYLEFFRCTARDPDFINQSGNSADQDEIRGLSPTEVSAYNAKTNNCTEYIDFNNCIKLVEVL